MAGAVSRQTARMARHARFKAVRTDIRSLHFDFDWPMEAEAIDVAGGDSRASRMVNQTPGCAIGRHATSAHNAESTNASLRNFVIRKRKVNRVRPALAGHRLRHR